MIRVAPPLTLNTDTGEVTCRNKKDILSQSETHILEILMVDPGNVKSRMDLRLDGQPVVYSNLVDVHIKNIRRKIGDKRKSIIISIRGKGYKLAG